MKLADLLAFDNIIVQCHDNPDADAIASGYGVYLYLKEKGKKVRFVYGGRYRIRKSNLVLMVENLKIPIEHVDSISDFDLLVTVDCQYREGNVTYFPAKNVAVIDHHQVLGMLPKMAEVRSNIGSCSTIIREMLADEGIDVNNYPLLATALYYGLMTDTNGFTEVSHPLDKDLRDDVIFLKKEISRFRTANLSMEELLVAGKALMQHDYIKDYRFAIVRTDPCDPNILGMISDLLLEVDEVDCALVYNVQSFGVKLSIRSCIVEVKASELAEYLTRSLGSGGGHLDKAGGLIQMDIFLKKLGKEEASIEEIHDFLRDRISDYFDGTEVIYSDKYDADIATMDRYKKKKFIAGYVNPNDIFRLDTKISIRTMEGDVDVLLKTDTLIMIGGLGEIYPTNERKFRNNYRILDESYEFKGEYEPTIKDVIEGKNISIIPFAKACESTGGVSIYVKKLDHRVKVFTAWDDENYYLGNEGDYLAVRSDDLKDVFVIEQSIFDESYEKE